MNKTLLLISASCLSLSVHAAPNNAPTTHTNSMVPQNFNSGNSRGFNNGSNWSMPSFNMGNNHSGSNWNMPNMNVGNSKGSGFNMPNMNFGNGFGNNKGGSSNFSMPNMNMGNGFGNNRGTGSNFKMPNMNWGNGNGTGSGFNMPNMNWGNGKNNGGNNWSMPSFNSGSNNAPGNWMPKQKYNNYVQPNRAFQPQRTFQQPRAVQAQVSPQQKPVQAPAPQPSVTVQTGNSGFPPQTINQTSTAKVAPKVHISNPAMRIPKPSELRGIRLAPENRAK